MTGRRPTPVALKILKNNPGKRPLPAADVAVPALPGDTPPPPSLSPGAQTEWRRLLPVLVRAGLATVLDADALRAYCTELARYEAANAEVERNGPVIVGPTGRAKVSPYYTVAAHALKSVRAFQIEFGLTPASRSRVSPTPPLSPSNPLDKFTRRR
jgi:P27 family predicted phage terminase small subunit